MTPGTVAATQQQANASKRHSPVNDVHGVHVLEHVQQAGAVETSLSDGHAAFECAKVCGINKDGSADDDDSGADAGD